MLKTISAAIVAVSVLAVPAMAGATVVKQVHAGPAAKTVVLKKSVRNANDRMIVVKKHHHHRFHHRHHR